MFARMARCSMESAFDGASGADCAEDSDDLLVGRLLVLARLLRANLARRLTESDASMPTWAVLSALNKDEGVSQRQLGDECRLEGPTITRHLDLLEYRGLVRRERDRRDRRIMRVRFTPAGKRYYAELEQTAADFDESMRSVLTPQDHAGLTNAIERLMAAL